MKREDLIAILCKLTYKPYDSFNTLESSFSCEFDKRMYEVKLKKTDAMLVSFHIEDKGAVTNEDN